MERQKFDRSSKWLIQNHGRSILFLGGARGVRLCRASQAEIVQPSQLPDGLLEVTFEDQKKPDYVLLEIATYPEKRVARQVLNDLTLAYQTLKTLPELLTVVLAPKGKYRVSGSHILSSRLQWSELICRWKVVELWTLPAEELLAANDVGLIPWVSLTHFAGPPEAFLERCRERIEKQARPDEQANLLAVSQVLAQLRYKEPNFLALLGGKKIMIESPLINEIVAEKGQNDIIQVLKERHGSVPLEVVTQLRSIKKEKVLMALLSFSAVCSSLEAFRERLVTQRSEKKKNKG